MKKLISLVLAVIIANSLLFSQNKSNSSSEKVYLHTDRSEYFAGETIWLKAYLANTDTGDTAKSSSFIYVELFGDSLISRIKIKEDSTGFDGWIKIPDNQPAGYYTLRAYTRWMTNFTEKYFFSKEITIVTPKSLATGNKSLSIQSGSSDYIDVQFFPEGGRYFPGISSKIAFKAISHDGGPVKITGKLFSKDGSPECEFESKHDGMGVVSIVNPNEKGYYAVVTTETGGQNRFELPEPEKKGASISVASTSGKVVVRSIIYNLPAGKYSLVFSNGAKDYYNKSIEIGESLNQFAKSSIPEGVNCAKILDKEGNILAERLFYIYAKDLPQIKIIPDKSVYSVRDSVGINIKIPSSDGFPLKGSFSVSVTDSAMVKENLNRENIISYMSLSSNLKGYINEPGYYFTNITPEKERNLDLLMMTQGWRYYYIEPIRDTIYDIDRTLPREFTQSISGKVSGLFRKDPKNTILMLYAPSIKFQQAFLLGNQSSFTVEGLNFPDSTSFLLGVSGRAGGQLYGLSIDQEKIPVYSKKIKSAFNKFSKLSDTNSYIATIPYEENVEKRNLQEIFVTADSKDRYNPVYNPSPFLQKFTRNQLKERKDLFEFDQMSVIDYLALTFPGLTVSTDTNNNRILLSTRQTSMSGPGQPLVYVDQMQWGDTGQLDAYGMKVIDLENIAFLKGNEGAMYRSLNGVILITTRRGMGTENKKNSNIQKVYPTGYQTKVKFYSPKYLTKAEKESPKKDFRRTMYWNPDVLTDINGNASFSFYTDDNLNTLNVRIEGMLIDGTPLVGDFKINRALKQP